MTLRVLAALVCRNRHLLRLAVEDELTIAEIHAAFKSGKLTCQALVSHYLKRIDAYDKNGPGINSIVDHQPCRYG